MNPYLADDSYPWLGEGALWNDAFANGQASPDAPSPLQQGTAPPMQPVPMQMGGGGGGGLEAAFNSPWAAMAGTALNNLANRDRPSQDPIAAYQQAVNRRAILDQRIRAQDMQETRAEAQEKRSQSVEERRAQLHPLAMQAAENKLDPSDGYNALVAQGLIDPTEMSFEDYKTMSAADNTHKDVSKYLFYKNLPKKERADFLEANRKPDTISGPGNTTWQVRPDGQAQLMGANQDQMAAGDAAHAARVADAKTSAAEWAKTNQDFAVNMQEKVPALAGKVTDLQRAMEIINAGGGDFGPAASLLGDIYNAENAELNAIAMTALLTNLAQVSTGALSEGEVKIFSQDLAKSDKSAESNRRLLERGLTLANRALNDIQRKGQYFVSNNGNLEGYEAQQLENIGGILQQLRGSPAPAGGAPAPAPQAAAPGPGLSPQDQARMDRHAATFGG